MRRGLLAVIILAVAIAGFAWLKNSAPNTPTQARQTPAVIVKTITVNKQALSPEVVLYGRLESPVDSTLTSSIDANVEALHVLEGDTVDTGSLLVSLDDTETEIILRQRLADVAEINAQIASEQARLKNDRALLATQQKLLDLTKKAVERAQTLQDRKLGSQSLIDEALTNQQQQQLALQQLQFAIADQPLRIDALKATLMRAEALLDQAEVDLQRTEIRAPFAGRITDIQVAVGERVQAGDPLLHLYDPGQLELRALIPSRYLNAVLQAFNNDKPVPGKAQINGQPFQFTLRQLAGEVQPESGGREGLFQLQGNSESLALGSFVSLQLKLPPQADLIALPFSALYGLDTVYRVIDNRLEALNVEKVGERLLENGEQQVLIRSPLLNDGDRLITTQLPNAISGLLVNPQ
ncbi:MAG TPA: HlyD family efflux transporter periplasmic adaptor subunit [Methylophaga sp.]|nr:HlyD family efflux transporter periplasmic adaptor subunit [Methylophaga sp.]